MTDPLETMTPRQFAVHMGYKAHYGNDLAKAGRLVFAPDGKRVLVAQSMARFQATKDPSKQGVADRHAAKRAQSAANAQPQTDGPESEDPEDPQGSQDTGDIPSDAASDTPSDVPLYNFQSSKAKREHWVAEREFIAFRKDAGELIEHKVHMAAMSDIGATVRSKLEAWAGTLPPQLAGRDEAAVRATLADQVELLLRELADRMLRHASTGQAAL